jgi:hypothetical protein
VQGSEGGLLTCWNRELGQCTSASCWCFKKPGLLTHWPHLLVCHDYDEVMVSRLPSYCHCCCAAMPLELAAAKSSVAHTEPAAGAVGFASAAARLRQTAATTFLHLRALNPYVQSIAASVKGRRGWLARREQAAVPLLDDSR